MNRIAIAGALVLLAGVPSGAQLRGPSGDAVLTGTVRDAANGRPVPRARVCAALPTSPRASMLRCADVDSFAAFRLGSLPDGTWEFEVECSMRGRIVTRIASDSISVSTTAPVRRDWAVDTRPCDPRPLRRVAGVFRGYYTHGFEASEFVPCVEDAWFAPSDSLETEPYDQRRAWVVLPDRWYAGGFRWPDAPRNAYGYPRHYVQWRGTIVGPGGYGHRGASAFEMRVDSIVEVRAPRDGDCRPVQEPRDRRPTIVPAAAHPNREDGEL